MAAKIILQQLGGQRFITMTGSKRFLDLGNGLRMSLARNKTQANRLEIHLDKETDTYTMRFYRRIEKKNFDIVTTEITNHEGVYCDMLEEIFTSVTGLYTRF